MRAKAGGVNLDPGKKETPPKEPRRRQKVSALRSGVKRGVDRLWPMQNKRGKKKKEKKKSKKKAAQKKKGKNGQGKQKKKKGENRARALRGAMVPQKRV